MRKEILKLFYVPLLGFLVFTMGYFFILYKVFDYVTKENLDLLSKSVIEKEKNLTKREIQNFENIVFLFQEAVYDTFYKDMQYFLSYIHYDKFIFNKNIIFGKMPFKLKYYVYKSKYYIYSTGSSEYLIAFEKRGNYYYVAGISKKVLDNLVLEFITKYLDFYNRYKMSYIALGKITAFNPKKDGIFGYIYYMPPKLKYLVGKKLSIYKADIKGNYYRKKYFNCLKNNKNCFVKYFFKNPETGNIEEKISYFSFIKDYNLSIVKGVYKSQIKAFLNKQASFYINRYKSLFVFSVFIYILTLTIFGLILFFILKGIKNKILLEYEIMKKEIEKKYYIDSLTHLPNRFKLLKDISENKVKCIAIIDIRDFGLINEVYGYSFGNFVLRVISKTLKSKFKYIYKFGNDEFVVSIDSENCMILEKELKNIFENFYVDKIRIEANIGLSNKPPLIETAELALYKAKHLNKFSVVFEENLKEEAEKKFENVRVLKSILKYKQLIPYYQCIVDRDGNIIKYEALMRLKKDNEILSPFVFMEEIKQAKLYSEFSFMMIKKVLAYVKKFKFNASINLSFEDISDERIKNFILKFDKDVLKYVTFEILESESVKNYEKVNKFISEVKNKGASIAIDDFGSGYSNFIQILELNTDFIKIDGSLVKNIKEEKYKEIIKFIIEFSKKFNIKTVAEFVEDKESFEILKELGIDYFQGYYFCKPLPFDKISIKKGHNENSN